MTDATTVIVEDADGPRRNTRRCVASRATGERETMVRFVVGPERRLVPDILGRLPGRGLWVGSRRAILEEALRRRSFARAARADVRIDVGLVDEVERLLSARCLELIGLAKRAGQLAVGFEQVEQGLRGRCGCVVIARDASVGQVARLLPRLGERDVVRLFDRSELGSPIGRGEATYLLIARGGLADTFVREAARLGGFRCDKDPVGGRADGRCEEADAA